VRILSCGLGRVNVSNLALDIQEAACYHSTVIYTNISGGPMAQFSEIDGEKFESDVLQSKKPVLLEFSAVWCGPCKMLEPVLNELAGEWGEDVTVVKMDVDQNAQIAGSYNILSIPTTILFKNGEVMERMVGFQPKEKITARVQPHLQPA
jgi:thioredoxin 1